MQIAGEVGVNAYAHVRLQIGARFVSAFVGATLDEDDIGGLEHSPGALTSLRYAQRLTGAPGRVTRILVRYAPRRARTAHASLTALARTWILTLRLPDTSSPTMAYSDAPG